MLSTSLTPFDIHDHLVQNNMCREAMEELVVLVEGEVYCTLCGKSFCLQVSHYYPNNYSMSTWQQLDGASKGKKNNDGQVTS
jgi:hypothetical protein